MASHKRDRTKGGAAAPTLDRELDRLFATAPADFTAKRDALARELAAAGDARAPEVKRLSRPTLLVWALNRLARDRPREIEALLGAAGRLEEGQRVALRGGGGSRLTAASDAFRPALGGAAREAERILAAAGHATTASMRVRLEAALRQAATGRAEERERLRRGRIEREPIPTAGDLESAFSASAAPPARRRAPSRAVGARREADPPREAQLGPDAATAARLVDARRVADALRAAKAELERSRDVLRAAEARARSARSFAEDAERRAAEQRARAAEADRSVAEARRRLDEAQARLRAAKDPGSGPRARPRSAPRLA